MIKQKDDKIIESTNEINRLNTLIIEYKEEISRLTTLLNEYEIDYLIHESVKTSINTERERERERVRISLKNIKLN